MTDTTLLIRAWCQQEGCFGSESGLFTNCPYMCLGSERARCGWSISFIRNAAKESSFARGPWLTTALVKRYATQNHRPSHRK